MWGEGQDRKTLSPVWPSLCQGQRKRRWEPGATVARPGEWNKIQDAQIRLNFQCTANSVSAQVCPKCHVAAQTHILSGNLVGEAASDLGIEAAVWGILVEGRPTRLRPPCPSIGLRTPVPFVPKRSSLPGSPSFLKQQLLKYTRLWTLGSAPPSGGPEAPSAQGGAHLPFSFLPPQERLELVVLEFLPMAAGE